MSKPWAGLSVLIVAGALIGSTSAAAAGSAPPSLWTAQTVEKVILSGTALVYGNPGGFGAEPVSAASCATVSGTRGAFKCAASWPSPNSDTITVHAVVYVRPWAAKRLCASLISASSCPPPLPSKQLANDPRRCPKLPDLVTCLISNAIPAMQAAVTASGVTAADGSPARVISCSISASAWTRLNCSTSGGSSQIGTVTFSLTASGWKSAARVG
jgi:hypothetical protein